MITVHQPCETQDFLVERVHQIERLLQNGLFLGKGEGFFVDAEQVVEVLGLGVVKVLDALVQKKVQVFIF